MAKSYSQSQACAERGWLRLRDSFISFVLSVAAPFCTVPEITLRTLCQASETSIQTVLHLVLEGTLHIDWWEPLGLDSSLGRTRPHVPGDEVYATKTGRPIGFCQ